MSTKALTTTEELERKKSMILETDNLIRDGQKSQEALMGNERKKEFCRVLDDK